MRFPAFWIAVVSLVLGFLPLLIYPFVLLADIMSLAAPRSGKQSFLLTVVSRSFQIGSLVYPLVYFPCLAAASRRLMAQKERIAAEISAIPIGLLIVLLILLWAWSKCEQK